MKKLKKDEAIYKLALSVFEDEPLLTMKELGKVLGVTRQTIYDAVNQKPESMVSRAKARQEYLDNLGIKLRKFGGRAE